MKTNLLSALAFSAVLALASCGGDTAPKADNQDAETQTEEQAQKAQKLEDELKKSLETIKNSEEELDKALEDLDL